MRGVRRSTYKGEEVTVSWAKHATEMGSVFFTAFYSLATGDQPAKDSLSAFQSSENAVAFALKLAHFAIDKPPRAPRRRLLPA